MTRLLSIAVAGMKAADTVIKSSGTNLSNSYTTAYKTEHVHLSSQIRSSGSVFFGNGVLPKAKKIVDNPMPSQVSHYSTHMAINGHGFFPATKSATSKLVATRSGAFEPDKDGNLVNPEGFFLKGIPLDATGTPMRAGQPLNIGAPDSLEIVNINKLNESFKATSTLSLKGNLPSDIIANNPVGQQISMVRVIDSLGGANDLTFTWNKTVDNPSTWTVGIAGNNIVSNPALITIVFNNDGTPNTFNGANAAPDIQLTWNMPNKTNPDQLTIHLDLGAQQTKDGLISIAANGNTVPLKQSQDGIEVGYFHDVSISQEGIMAINFNNGESMPIYMIPILNMSASNESSLDSSEIYSSTISSGQFVINKAKTGEVGAIISGALEQSATDQGAEFALIIEGTNLHSSCTRMILTAKQMHEELMMIFR